MRWLAILGILAYRAVVRPFLRRRCLYPESCSAHASRTRRALGYRRAVPLIQRRVQSCRLPEAACFVLDSSGRARLLRVDGAAPPAMAIELLARDAERILDGRGA